MNEFQLLINTFSDEEIESIRVTMVNSGHVDDKAWKRTADHLIRDIKLVQNSRKLRKQYGVSKT